MQVEKEETDGSTSKLPNPIPKFVDNKRKNMEINLSASQRDQVYLNMAKTEAKNGRSIDCSNDCIQTRRSKKSPNPLKAWGNQLVMVSWHWLVQLEIRIGPNHPKFSSITPVTLSTNFTMTTQDKHLLLDCLQVHLRHRVIIV